MLFNGKKRKKEKSTDFICRVEDVLGVKDTDMEGCVTIRGFSADWVTIDPCPGSSYDDA